ncbi:hypothetical protein GCM10009555_023680 [Acrocarpospora macrocephala]|uniref:Uncharacterized protein n=1 Tax=Acrocarpospora macrocephala TaxID=150177 RepID=A0A5M3WUD5_9ACTN|nr:hypothetical protein [Acrocarpospora macrocephala]GES12300.1 hypothetical protein Amac_058970 [Acrocarpospora macrocephala]
MTTPDAAALLDDDTDDVQTFLDALVQAQLLEVRAPDHYRMRTLIRLYARAQATHPTAAYF